MARRSNSTPPADTGTGEGATVVADAPAAVPDPSPSSSSSGAPVLELLTPTADANPRTGELAEALGNSPGENGVSGASPSSSSSSSSSSSDGYRRPDFKRWSANRTRKASRKELADRIKELEGIAETTPPASARGEGAPSGEAPGLTPEQVLEIAVASLGATFRVVSGIGERLRGAHWKLREEETAALAGAWAPVLAPHLGAFAAYLPIVGAVAVTAEVVLPRIERDMELAKAAGAEALPVSVVPNAAE